MLEPNISVQEEIVEVELKVLEQGLTNLVLNACRQFVVELELLDDQVIIVDKGILNEHFDRVVQVVGYLLLGIAILQSKQPHVQFLHSGVNEGFETLITAEHDRNGTSKQREEGETDKFHKHGEDVFYTR